MAEFQAITSNSAGYSEFFESTDSKDIEIGQTVVLDNGKVRIATSNDTTASIIGVVRPKNNGLTGSIMAKNTTTNVYEYELDEFGQVKEEKYYIWSWVDEKGINRNYPSDQVPSDVIVPENKTVSESARWKKTTNYSGLQPTAQDTAGYVLIGLLGQIPVKKSAHKPITWVFMKSLSAEVDLYFVSFNNKPVLGIL